MTEEEWIATLNMDSKEEVIPEPQQRNKHGRAIVNGVTVSDYDWRALNRKLDTEWKLVDALKAVTRIGDATRFKQLLHSGVTLRQGDIFDIMELAAVCKNIEIITYMMDGGYAPSSHVVGYAFSMLNLDMLRQFMRNTTYFDEECIARAASHASDYGGLDIIVQLYALNERSMATRDPQHFIPSTCKWVLRGFYGACSHGHLDIVNYYIEKGFVATSAELEHSLQNAVESRAVPMVRCILELGAIPTYRLISQLGPFYNDIVELLQEYAVKLTGARLVEPKATISGARHAIQAERNRLRSILGEPTKEQERTLIAILEQARAAEK